jgi:iron-sulfur cluster repair protein YtfE (RIC family)
MSAVTTACRLADLASTVPGATDVLDRFGLDSVLQQLVALPSGPPPVWTALPPSRLIEHIEHLHTHKENDLLFPAAVRLEHRLSPRREGDDS